MKSGLLIALLVVSASAAPQSIKSAGLERESGAESVPKSAKLQWNAADAQVYTTNTVRNTPVYAPVTQTVDVVRDLTVPSTLTGSGLYNSGLYGSSLYGNGAYGTNGVYGSGLYGSGLSTSSLYGSSLYNNGAYGSGLYNNVYNRRQPVSTTSYLYNTPATTITYSSPSSWSHGMRQVIDGNQAQYLNGQWYFLNSQNSPYQLVPYSHQIYTGTALYGQVTPSFNALALNGLNGVQTASLYPGSVAAAVIPSRSYGSTIINRSPAVAVGSVRPSLSSSWSSDKWYTNTKTNARPVGSPFYAQSPLYVQSPSLVEQTQYRSGATPSAVRSVKPEAETDWE